MYVFKSHFLCWSGSEAEGERAIDRDVRHPQRADGERRSPRGQSRGSRSGAAGTRQFRPAVRHVRPSMPSGLEWRADKPNAKGVADAGRRGVARVQVRAVRTARRRDALPVAATAGEWCRSAGQLGPRAQADRQRAVATPPKSAARAPDHVSVSGVIYGQSC